METHAPHDIDGKDLRVGDWVRVLIVPLSIEAMPRESKQAFSDAVGHSFQIEAFDEIGHIELDLWPKVGSGTIWLEPFCVRRFRRYKRLSRSFQRRREQRSAPRPPRYEVTFDVTLKDGVDVEAFGRRLTSLGTGGGFACWLEDRRVRGTVWVDKSGSGALESIETTRRTMAESKEIESAEIGDIAETQAP